MSKKEGIIMGVVIIKDKELPLSELINNAVENVNVIDIIKHESNKINKKTDKNFNEISKRIKKINKLIIPIKKE